MTLLRKLKFQEFSANRSPAALTKTLIIMLCFTLVFAGVPVIALAQPADPILSLKDVPVQEPPNLSDFIKDKNAAIALGKALFWDMQLGSDSVQACASCHYQAGADPRTKGQLNPNTNGGDVKWGNSGLEAIPGAPTVEDHNPPFGPNYQVNAGDFPFHSRNPETQGVPRPTTPGQEFSSVVIDTNDVMSSQGVRFHKFLGVVPGSSVDIGLPLKDPVFRVKGGNIRRVEPRNTPTMINAVFSGDLFWEGRASMIFNGVNPFGFRDQDSTLKKNVNGTLTDTPVRLPYSALASQAVGPPVSDFEMSFQGRDFPRIGRKMLSLRPLALQLVHPEDSVLGSQSRARLARGKAAGLKGLKAAKYSELVKKAFKDEWWNSSDICRVVEGTQFVHEASKQNPRTFVVNPGRAIIEKWKSNFVWGPNDFSQMEYNFSLFFGLAVQLYEATLISDDTPLDKFLGANYNVRGGGTKLLPDPFALTEQEQLGLNLFNNPALGCALCHTLPETTEHTNRTLAVDTEGVPRQLVRFLPDGNGGLFNPTGTAYIDFGMRNLAHRPTEEDIGRGGTAPDLPPFQNPLDDNKPFPLSYVELWKLKTAVPSKLPPAVAAYVPDVANPVIPGLPAPAGNKTVKDGAFKVPNLRNCVHTGPYFHDGGYSTFRQVVQFYARGGNFPQTNSTETALGIVPLSPLDPADPLKTDEQKAEAEANIQALVAFMARGLTDERVTWQKAPFDHPQLFVPNGAKDRSPGSDSFIEIPPVGKNGHTTPLSTFLDLDPQSP
jgi:cytochrome c peroxidase